MSLYMLVTFSKVSLMSKIGLMICMRNMLVRSIESPKHITRIVNESEIQRTCLFVLNLFIFGSCFFKVFKFAFMSIYLKICMFMFIHLS